MTKDIDNQEFKRRDFLKETSYAALGASGHVGLSTTSSVDRAIADSIEEPIDSENNKVIITTVKAGDQPVVRKKYLQTGGHMKIK